ncbi:MAG TPA: signal peptidase I [Verrucomicrobiales bacterium]|nr:signal peptidase I [Verrucomicrobiales bacterium]
MLSPRWKKDARLLSKGARKFLNYKRDLMGEEQVSHIEDARLSLNLAIKAGDRERIAETSQLLTEACENALSGYRRPGFIAENLEVLFVAIVIALGIRGYFLQPFRIPTGSMQPTLNGIVGHELTKDEFPSVPIRTWQAVMNGRRYIHKVVNGSSDRRYLERISEGQRLQFFTVTELHFRGDAQHDPEVLRLPAPRSALQKMGLQINTDYEMGLSYVPPHTTVSGFSTTGDLVLVDKFSYNFRRPRRGEVFVFDTRGIKGIHQRSQREQGAGSHYIKRLAAIPGDKVEIDEPLLVINDQPATEKYLRMIGNREGIYSGPAGVGYQPTRNYRDPLPQFIRKRGDSVHLKTRDTLLAEGNTGAQLSLNRGYFALGDNTDDSLDSRYWGPVREYNLVGPAFLSLWPFTSGHWGLIR